MTLKNNSKLYLVSKRNILQLPVIEKNLINTQTLYRIRKIEEIHQSDNGIFDFGVGSQEPSFFSFKEVTFMDIYKYPNLIQLKVRKDRKKLRSYLDFINSGIVTYKAKMKSNKIENVIFLELIDKIEKNIPLTAKEFKYYSLFLEPIDIKELQKFLLSTKSPNKNFVKCLLFRFIILSLGNSETIKKINYLYKLFIENYNVTLDVRILNY